MASNEVESAEQVWRCTAAFAQGDGGVWYSTKYAKTRQDMLILRDQGYECVRVEDAE